MNIFPLTHSKIKDAQLEFNKYKPRKCKSIEVAGQSQPVPSTITQSSNLVEFVTSSISTINGSSSSNKPTQSTSNTQSDIDSVSNAPSLQ